MQVLPVFPAYLSAEWFKWFYKSRFDRQSLAQSPPSSRLFAMSVGDYDPSEKSPAGMDIVTDKVDAESHNEPKQDTLQRQLKNRHVAMIRYFPTFFS
jgi:amino acid permease